MTTAIATGLTLVTAPAVEVVTAAQVKSHARIDTTADDTHLSSFLIPAARRHLESAYNLAMVNQTWDLALDEFPNDPDRPIWIPRYPLVSITSITYVDTAGASQTWASSKYRVDTAHRPGRVTPAYGETWPSTRDQTGAVVVRFVAGHGAAATDVPEVMRLAVMAYVAHLYAHRELVTDQSLGAVPSHITWMLADAGVYIPEQR